MGLMQRLHRSVTMETAADSVMCPFDHNYTRDVLFQLDGAERMRLMLLKLKSFLC